MDDSMPQCEDCGLRYDEFGMDTVLRDSQWLAIHPSGRDGFLCANCIVRRAGKLQGALVAVMVIEIYAPTLPAPGAPDSEQE